MTEELSTIKVITNFLFIESKPVRKVDLIFVFGSSCIETMDEVKTLYDKKIANKILITGHSKGRLKEIEADRFYKKGIELGIPKEVFLLEKNAINTKENIVNSISIIKKSLGFRNIRKIMFVCKSFHARRVLMTAKRHFPKDIKYYFFPIVDERNIKQDNWWKNEVAKNRVLDEVRRIGEYALKGDLALE